jgi:hypothetical protein
MAMEFFVFSDRRLETVAEWNSALAKIGFEVVIEEIGKIAELRGHQPTKLRGRDVWIEYDHFDPIEFLESMKEYVQTKRSWKYLLALRFGGDFHALAAAQMVAAAYAKMTNGVVLDEFEPIFRTWQETADEARKTEEQIPMLEASLAKATAELSKKIDKID